MTFDCDGFVLPFPDDPGNHKAEDEHNNSTSSGGMTHADILRLYNAGMEEAIRVIRQGGGQIWVKRKG